MSENGPIVSECVPNVSQKRRLVKAPNRARAGYGGRRHLSVVKFQAVTRAPRGAPKGAGTDTATGLVRGLSRRVTVIAAGFGKRRAAGGTPGSRGGTPQRYWFRFGIGSGLGRERVWVRALEKPHRLLPPL